MFIIIIASARVKLPRHKPRGQKRLQDKIDNLHWLLLGTGMAEGEGNPQKVLEKTFNGIYKILGADPPNYSGEPYDGERNER